MNRGYPGNYGAYGGFGGSGNYNKNRASKQYQKLCITSSVIAFIIMCITAFVLNHRVDSYNYDNIDEVQGIVTEVQDTVDLNDDDDAMEYFIRVDIGSQIVEVNTSSAEASTYSMGQFVTLYRDKNGGAYYLNQSQVAVSKSHYFIGYIIVVFALFLQFLVWLIFYRKLGWLKGGIIFVILAYLFGALLHLS